MRLRAHVSILALVALLAGAAAAMVWNARFL